MESFIPKVKRLFVVALVWACVVLIISSVQSEPTRYDVLCNQHIPAYFQSARDSVIRVWTVLDLLQSITIEPKDRVRFAGQILDDMLAILTDINALSCTCKFCEDYCSQRHDDITYLEELLVNMSESFRAVFAPVRDGEEQMLHTVLMKTAVLLDGFKVRILKSQPLD